VAPDTNDVGQVMPVSPVWYRMPAFRSSLCPTPSCGIRHDRPLSENFPRNQLNELHYDLY
jgi:hypothetical protein